MLVRILGLTLAVPLGVLVPSRLSAQGASIPKVGGYVQAREVYQRSVGLTSSLNRARVAVDGTIPGNISYRVQVEYEAGGTATTAAAVSLRDAYIKWNAAPFSITAGQFKTPFTREFLTSITVIETADRSTVVDSLAPKRDIGLMGQLDLGTNASVMVGVFNGEGQNRIINKDSTVLAVARLTARPIPQMTLGANVAAYGSDSTRYGVDANLELRGILVRGEYVAQRRPAHGPIDNGWFGLAGYRLVPWLQLVAKQEIFRRPAISSAQRNEATTAGANVDLPGGRVRFIADYVSRALGTPPVRKGALITQLQVRF